MAKRNYDIECPVCEEVTLVEVVSSDDVPEHCPMCGQSIVLDEEFMDDEDYE